MTTATDQWHKTACVLCSANCGVEIKLDGRRFARVRGDKDHVESKGYTCEKALRLDHYQNGRHRLTRPMRRTATSAASISNCSARPSNGQRN